MSDRFKTRAKEIIDAMFDAKAFRGDITRDDMQATEDFIAWSMENAWNYEKRCEALLERLGPLAAKSEDQTETT